MSNAVEANQEGDAARTGPLHGRGAGRFIDSTYTNPAGTRPLRGRCPSSSQPGPLVLASAKQREEGQRAAGTTATPSASTSTIPRTDLVGRLGQEP